MLHQIKQKYPFIFFLIFFLVFFRKVIFLGLMPIPSDLLVSFYFPFSSGGFAEYSPWVPNKAQVADDSLRQQYPWKLFSASQIKKGELPLWNPYAFSGYPLLANVQTAVFYPFNLLFAILNPKTAWTILILLQSILSSLFMYLFLRSLKLGKQGAIMGALIYVGMSFELFWLEQMIIGHTTLWLPLILLSFQKLAEGQKKWLIVGFLSLILSILGGYSQTTLYVFIISFFFLLHKIFSRKDKLYRINLFIVGSLLFVLSLGITAIQLVPTAEIYQFSAREGAFSEKLYEQSLTPSRNILTLLYADFFGNMATHNYWGDQHTDFNHYFGSIPFLILLTGLFMFFQKKIDLKEGKFFLALGLVGWLFALQTPFGYLPGILKIPILSTGVVARFLFVFQFCLGVVAAICFDRLSDYKEQKIFLKPAMIIIILCLMISVIFLLLIQIFTGQQVVKAYHVGLRNIIFAGVIFFTGFCLLFLTKYRKIQNLCFILLICLTAFEFIYLGNKYLPISKKEYLFPDHPLFSFLQSISGINRIWGQSSSYLTANFPMVYNLHYSDGYDSLFIKRYGEFVYSSRDGKIPTSIPRSDVNLSPNEDWKYKERMLDILGIKYVLDKNDLPKADFEPEPWKFLPDRYQLIWQNGKFKVYQNLKAWPRIYFAKDLIVKKENQEIVDYLLKSKNSNIAVVEETIPAKISVSAKGRISDIDYTPNKIDFKVNSDKDSFLVLSDNYYPGWVVKIDGVKAKIYRTNYTFRGIVVPQGTHDIEYIYQPQSLKIGFYISLISIFISIVFIIIYLKRNDKKDII